MERKARQYAHGSASRYVPGLGRALLVAALWGLSSCVSPHPGLQDRTPLVQGEQQEVGAVIQSFVRATEERRFADVLEFLSKDLRDRYTPHRLEHDFDAEPYAKERIVRLKASKAVPLVRGREARVVWTTDRAVTLVREETGWKIASLE